MSSDCSQISVATLLLHPSALATTGANSAEVAPAPPNAAFCNAFLMESSNDLPSTRLTASVPSNAASADRVILVALSLTPTGVASLILLAVLLTDLASLLSLTAFAARVVAFVAVLTALLFLTAEDALLARFAAFGM